MSLRWEGEVAVVDLGAADNRFTHEASAALLEITDELTSRSGPRALVTTAEGKIWSNGLDLDWLLPRLGDSEGYLDSVHELLARFLELPVPTLAAIGGHAFAAGAMLALCHDTRLMREDRGYLCLPEVDLGLPFTPGMSALLQARLMPQVAHEAMTTGRRYGGREAMADRIVDMALPAERVLDEALERAASLAPHAGSTLGSIKRQLYGPVLGQLRTLTGS